MMKTVIVEYVGIEDIQEIMDDALALMREGDYVEVQVENLVDNIRVSVHIMLNGFDMNKEYDYDYQFYMTDNAKDVEEMNACKSIIKNLLVEE